jgi:hypothetical protein
MKYICVKWKHSLPDEPILLYSEVDDDRLEVRKVEVYRDGRKGYAGPGEASASTRLAQQTSLPSLAEIAADPQFEPAEITPEQFEEVWEKRRIPNTP